MENNIKVHLCILLSKMKHISYYFLDYPVHVYIYKEVSKDDFKIFYELWVLTPLILPSKYPLTSAYYNPRWIYVCCSLIFFFLHHIDSTCRFELVASNNASVLQIAKRPPGIETWPAFMKS